MKCGNLLQAAGLAALGANSMIAESAGGTGMGHAALHYRAGKITTVSFPGSVLLGMSAPAAGWTTVAEHAYFKARNPAAQNNIRSIE
jgi:hypothetical protein